MKAVQGILNEINSVMYKQDSIRKTAKKMEGKTSCIRMSFENCTTDGAIKTEYFTIKDARLKDDVKEVILENLRKEYSDNSQKLKLLIEEIKCVKVDEEEKVKQNAE